MKRHQQQRSKPPQVPIPVRLSQAPRRKAETPFSLSRFVWTRPLAVLGGAWVVVAVVALVAVSGLLSPDSSNGKRNTETAIARNTAETTQIEKHQSRLPLWLFGAIALSCAAGCVLVSKQAMRPPRLHTRPPKSIKPKHLTPYPAPSALELLEPAMLPLPSQTAPATMPSFALEPRQPQTVTDAPFMAPVTLMQLAHMQLNQASAAAVAPTASASPEEKAPLNWGEASLADKLDLRKPRSVSSLL